MSRRPDSRRGRVGLALAGGGPIGAMYELGALRAVEEAVTGLDLNDVHAYVGVSAGSFVAACLANGITTRQMLGSVLSGGRGPFPLQPDLFFTPAYGEIARRGLKIPRLAAEAIWQAMRRRSHRSIGEVVSLLSQALPVGIFDNEPIRAYMHELLSSGGRTDDFRELRHSLTVVAADLDTGTTMRFGAKGLNDIPISRAVQASTAVPGVYPPVPINGRQCVDGVLLKTVHASVALEQGAELLFCINPLVPVDVSTATHAGRVPENALVALGLPAVMSQTFRTLIHSRLELGLSRYGSRFPDADIVLLEPTSDEYAMFFSNIFSFRTRVAICERGYSATRRELLRRLDELTLVLRSHGYELRADVLADPERDVWMAAGLEEPRHEPVSALPVLSALDRALTKLERGAATAALPAAR